MRTLTLLLLALISAIIATSIALDDMGLAIIAWGDFLIQINFVTLLLILIAAAVVTGIVVWLLYALLRLPQQLRNRYAAHQSAKSQQRLGKGLMLLAEGKTLESEKALLLHAERSPIAASHYLYAARAAQQRGATGKRDLYVRLALEHAGDDKLPLQLAYADMLIERGEFSSALHQLHELKPLVPKDPNLLRLLACAYENLQDWQALHELLPELAHEKIYDQAGFHALTLRTESQRLRTAESRVVLEECWESLPKKTRLESSLIFVYAERLAALGAEQKAVEVLRRALQQHWDDALIRLFGQLEDANLPAQITQAEKWLARHADSAALQLALARLCLKDKLWGKARNYLENSIALAPSQEACHLLGQLLERLGETQAAFNAYRRGMELGLEATQDSVALPQTAATPALMQDSQTPDQTEGKSSTSHQS